MRLPSIPLNIVKLLIPITVLVNKMSKRNQKGYYILPFKGTLSPHEIFSYMKHMDPLSTKKSSEFHNPLKNTLKVQFSVLNRAKNAPMAPHYHPQMRQWLRNARFTIVG